MAQEPQPVPEGQAAAVAAPVKKKSPLPIVIATALLVGPLAFGAFTLKQTKAKAHEALVKQWEKTAPKFEASFTMPQITVNLAKDDRYCRFTPVVSFELDVVDCAYFKSQSAKIVPAEGEQKKGGEGEGEGKEEKKATDPTVPKTEPGEGVKKLVEELPFCLPKMTDSAITLVSSKNFEELTKVKGKDDLRKELAERFTEIVAKALEEAKIEDKFPVTGILFSDFIMQ